MAEMDKKTQERISFLSLLSSAANFADDPYDQAKEWLAQMQEDGFFSGGGSPRSSKPSGRSGGRGSSSRSSGNSRGGNSGGGGMRNPNGPPTDKQVAKVLSLTDEYSEDELYDFSKSEISDLIDDLLNG